MIARLNLGDTGRQAAGAWRDCSIRDGVRRPPVLEPPNPLVEAALARAHEHFGHDVTRLEAALADLDRLASQPGSARAQRWAWHHRGHMRVVANHLDDEIALLEAAVTAFEEGGEPLGTGRTRALLGFAHFSVAIGHDAESVFIDVFDHGSGIPASEQHRMFEPFARPQSADRVSTSIGLGLPVSHELAHLMGGTLTYRRDSRLTAFRLRVPFAPPTLDHCERVS